MFRLGVFRSFRGGGVEWASFCGVEWASFLGSSGHPFCVKHHWGAVRWTPPEGFQRGQVGILRVLRLGLQMKSRTFVSRRVVRMVPRQRIDCGGLWDVGGDPKP